MSQTTIKNLERVMNLLDKIDLESLNFGKVTTMTTTENHDYLVEVQRKLRTFATDLATAEKAYADRKFMKNTLKQLYSVCGNDPERIKQTLNQAIERNRHH